MNKFCLFFICLLIATSLIAENNEIVLHTPQGNLYGTLTLPSSATNKVVLIIAGSGPTDRDGNNPMMKNNSLKMLATLLEENGIASLRYDKRGIGQSQTAGFREADLRFDHYIDDAKAWVQFLKKEKHYQHIIIAGHSEGALIGMLASQSNADVASYISLAGAALPIQQILKKQLSAQPQAIQDLCFPIIDKLARGDTVADVSPLLYSLFRPSVQPYLISCFKYDPTREIAKLSQPILLIQGDTDIQVTADNAEHLAKAQPKAKKVIIPDMNHILKTCKTTDKASQMATYTNADIPLHPDLEKTLVTFLESVSQESKK